ncbi:probable dolichyl pyrophosphate Man9GlcNAc2 alpha-1,3-glucosyltransferase isoform X2 [Momordica charantia]|uniref:Alpha-1,3-glucosyltransferase n=1 Tax=Momordica charantia TaxID=3673 RepID=A0A6J1D290_MOMCH|nr:probable dolichyl pyrophosphate Man9GlcNAc2 alpha-1,3-glucosyltransferase isoform X2 [Momordica charantia]
MRRRGIGWKSPSTFQLRTGIGTVPPTTSTIGDLIIHPLLPIRVSFMLYSSSYLIQSRFHCLLLEVMSPILVFYFVLAYFSSNSSYRKSDIAWQIAILLLNPCLILIDHGHFQYNCISLGLTVGAIAAICTEKDLVGSFLFTLALNHKQMSAYFAPAFFSHLLGKCMRHRNPIVEVLKLGLVVLGTFAIIWSPYLHSVDDLLQVLSRLAPFERGIYEDYVANFWCTTSVLIKWKRLFSVKLLKFLSFTATLSACLPSMVQQIRTPSKQGFLYGLLCSSFSFYLFSFQVHEKSILLPLLPASMLALDEPSLFRHFLHYALLSMFPLVVRDKLVQAYLSIYALTFLIINASNQGRQKMGAFLSGGVLFGCLLFCSLVLHIVYLVVRPPERYPFIFEAVIMLLCFSQFMFIAVFTNIKQWTLSKAVPQMDKQKFN